MRRLIPSVLAAAALPTLALAQQAAPQPDAAPATAKGETSPPPAKPPLGKPGDKTKTVGEVVVTGQVSPVQSSIDRKSYSLATDLKAQSGGSVADSLRNVPAVEVDIQGNVSLRGDSNVTILVDGKPSSLLSGDTRAQALQSMPADSIERVEVITNPSAEFGANGSAGVINLITKKSRGAGFTGSLRVTGGDSGRIKAGATVGYNSARLNFTGELGVYHDTLKITVFDLREQRATPQGPFQTVFEDQVNDLFATAPYGRGSIDFDLTPKTQIGAEGHFNLTSFHGDVPSRFSDNDPADGLASTFLRDVRLHESRSAGELSVNLRRKLAGDGEFKASLSGEEVNDPRERFGETFDSNPPAPAAFVDQPENIHQHHVELKGDLTQPFADMSKLKAGVDIDYVDNSYRDRAYIGTDAAALVLDPTQSNLFLFRQTVSAAYATYEKPIGELTVLGGLRVEDVRIHLDQATLGETDVNHYANVYPTLHLGWKLSDDQSLTASYSHRVQRPDPILFNPFRLQLDPLDFQSGDPHLKPSQTQSFEVGYERHQGASLFSATLFYRGSRDIFLRVQRDLGGGITLNQLQNVAQVQLAGLDTVLTGKLGSALSYNVSAEAAWKHFDSLGPQFAPARSLVAGSGRGSLTWQASAKDLFQLNGSISQKGLTPQGTVYPLRELDLGYRRKLGEKLFLLVTLQDVLHSYLPLTVNSTPLLRERIKTELSSRQAQIGLTWAFGGGKPKDPGFEFQNGGGGAGPTP
ncbi:TonB-dependent receptor domain-containing protein [Phenylobacterium sp.]|uniref:TonB-dependent receptor domain-containing protein n=1 Tax=Phenylobacterium sp. TaxID=1871053 RepID=UPI002F3EC2DF